MNDLTAYLKRVLRGALFLLSICLLAWVLLEPYRPYIAGLMLGMAVSLINAYFLSFKIRQLTEMVARNTGKRINLGFLSRVATALLAVMAAVRMDAIDVIATMAGMFYVPAAVLLLGLFSQTKK